MRGMPYCGLQDRLSLCNVIAEWMDDPYINNSHGACGGILENCDPLENTADFGDFVTNRERLRLPHSGSRFLKYFGQTPSANDWWTLQDYPITSVCQFGQ